MRRIILPIIALTFLAAIAGCKKGKVVSDIDNLGTGSYVTLVRTIANTLNYANINTSSASITVRQYGEAIDKIKVYVSSGPKTLNKGNWKFIKDVPYSGDSVTITVTSQELATALGIPVSGLQPGTSYTFYNQVITKSGKTFDIVNTPQHGISNYNMALNWGASVVCPFTGNMAGNYTVIQDEWADWSPGAVVPVTNGPGANQVNLSQVWPNPAYGTVVQPFVVNVDPATGAATVTSGVTIGNYSAYGFTMVTGSGSSGFVFSCTGRITLRVRISAPPFGDQGFLNLILQKI